MDKYDPPETSLLDSDYLNGPPRPFFELPGARLLFAFWTLMLALAVIWLFTKVWAYA